MVEENESAVKTATGREGGPLRRPGGGSSSTSYLVLVSVLALLSVLALAGSLLSMLGGHLVFDHHPIALFDGTAGFCVFITGDFPVLNSLLNDDDIVLYVDHWAGDLIILCRN